MSELLDALNRIKNDLTVIEDEVTNLPTEPDCSEHEAAIIALTGRIDELKQVFTTIRGAADLALNLPPIELPDDEEPTDPPTEPPTGSYTRDGVIQFLKNLPEDRLLIGQQMQHDAEPTAWIYNYLEEQMQTIYDQGGVPAIVGFDLNERFNANGDYSKLIEWVTGLFNAGTLPLITWHMTNPWHPEDLWFNSERFDYSQILPGGSHHAVFKAYIDSGAGALLELKRRGIPVLFRPFHEMNLTESFWWAHWEFDQYQELWRWLHDYYTNEFGLDNLIWVFAPNDLYSEYGRSGREHYPGDSYVDVIGIDKYWRGTEGVPFSLWRGKHNFYKNNDGDAYSFYKDMLALAGDKPLFLTEVGPQNPSAPDENDRRYNYHTLVNEMISGYPELTGFNAWEWVWRMGFQGGTAETFADPRTLDAGDLLDLLTD